MGVLTCVAIESFPSLQSYPHKILYPILWEQWCRKHNFSGGGTNLLGIINICI